MGDEKIKLQTHDNQSWTPVQHPYVLSFLTTYARRALCVCRGVSPTTKMSVEIHIHRKSNYLSWVKKGQTTKQIDLQNLFNIYWTPNEHELKVQGQS